jgi:iron-sulfur cluster protein
MPGEDMKAYKRRVREALDDEFLARALDAFARAYPDGRARAFEGRDPEALAADVGRIKDDCLGRLEELYERFRENAEKAGATVHRADSAEQANAIIARIAADNRCRKVVKSKSMTAEEIHLNSHLEAHGLDVAETDLGEWIVQLRREGPSHMVLPAIHLSREQVAGLFSEVTGRAQEPEVEQLVKVARRELRRRFVEADMGITGANLAVADSGTLGLVTNEGNARLTATLPRVHVALVGLEKLAANLDQALSILEVLPRNATGQRMTTYLSWITGAAECGASASGAKQLHIVFLDNGRSELARDPDFREILRCVRCGACANVCPVYRMVGGHSYGYVYIGAVGLVLTYLLHGRDKARNVVKNCLNCQACRAVCAADIDLPGLIAKVQTRLREQEGASPTTALLSLVMRDRRLFHGMLRAATLAQKPLGQKTGEHGDRFIRHLPAFFLKEHGFRELPPLAGTPFRDRVETLGPRIENPARRVALFAGCAGDFIYPEHLEAALRTFRDRAVDVEFPQDQTCCGLPLAMNGDEAVARAVAEQNLRAFEASQAERVVTLCASCASHLKSSPELFPPGSAQREAAQRFADRVVDYSSYVQDVLQVRPEEFRDSGARAAYHSPCHLCRGLGVRAAPRTLLRTIGLDCVEMDEEEVCCGFGGSYTLKFPKVSSRILGNKLDAVQASGAELLVTDCPGCILQIRGGLARRDSPVEVRHMAEVLDRQRRETARGRSP